MYISMSATCLAISYVSYCVIKLNGRLDEARELPESEILDETIRTSGAINCSNIIEFVH